VESASGGGTTVTIVLPSSDGKTSRDDEGYSYER